MKTLFLLAAAIALMPVAEADAWQTHRRHAGVSPPSYADRAPGWEIRALSQRAQDEPGVTAELSPGAKQTATGGPSGGVPGFSGH